MTGYRIVRWDDWFFRIANKGFSVQPLKSEYHKHMVSTRRKKIQPLHILGHCFKYLS